MTEYLLRLALNLGVLFLVLTGLQHSLPSGQGHFQSVLIVVPSSWQDDSAVALAVQDLTASLAARHGSTTLVLKDNDLPRLPPDRLIFLLGNDNNRWVKGLAANGELSVPSLSSDGYHLQRLPRLEDPPLVVVLASHPRGLAYGLFRLAERLQLDGEVLSRPLKQTVEPDMTFRLVSNPTGGPTLSPQEALRLGFNAIAIEPWPTLASYRQVEPSIYSPQLFPEEAAWLQENRRRAQEEIAAAKSLHLQVVSSGDVPSLPKQVFNIFGLEVGELTHQRRLCLDRPLTQRLISAALDEVLTDFPEIDAIMVRTGENYPLGPLVGTTPQEARCGSDAPDLTRTVIDLVRHQVIDIHGKTYIHRAWDLGNDGTHADPAVSARLLGGIAPTERLVLSFKITETDFWRYNNFNPNLGRGPFPQLVEFQAAREYEGKGAFPNYLGAVYAEGGNENPGPGGIRQAYAQGVRWVWVWDHGGGWGGPHLANDLWVDANIYALAKLSWNTQEDPYVLARDWASLRLGPQAAPRLARLMLRSEQAVLKAFYLEPYARVRGSWAPNVLWVRDDVIGGGGLIVELYRSLRQDDAKFRAALAEKAAAVALVESMMVDFQEAATIVPNRKQAKEAYNTLRYEKVLFQVFRYYLSGMFYYYRWTDSGRQDVAAQQQARENLEQWRDAWASYRQDIGPLPGVASLFQSQGMMETAYPALQQLDRAPAR